MLLTFDAGVYVSAFRFQGVPEQALRQSLVLDSILFCDELEAEVTHIMRDKFRFTETETRLHLEQFLKGAKRISVPHRLQGLCRDPNDDYLLELALTGNSFLIVTGDKDLLTLHPLRNIQIQAPRQYLDAPRLRLAQRTAP